MQAFVALNRQRESCIVVSMDLATGTVQYIPFTGTELAVKRCSLDAWREEGWVRYTDYPVRRCAQIYTNAPAVILTAEAQRHLEFLLVDPATAYNEADFNKEYVMATKAKATEGATEDKFNKLFKAGDKPQATEAAVSEAKAAKGAKAAKAKPAKAPAAAKPKAEKAAKAPAVREGKIQVLNKENPHREGTGRAEAFNAMLKCKTVQAYAETGNKMKYLKDWTESKHITVA